MVYFDLYGVDPNLGGMLPSELDGAAPPAGSPNYFVQVDDDAWGYSPDQLQAWKFAVNWTSPSSSTFTLHRTLATAAFDSNMCSYARSCIPQAGTSTKLDAISDRLMYRLQYRNLGTHDALVVNHTVDVSGNDRAGVRWYEVRNPGSSAVTIHQQGTFAPADGAHRWMGSAAMDSAGNIALGYNASSGSVSPSIRYTARCASDPAGQMTQGEADLIIGSGAQTSSSSRWGDYSMLGIDPVDGRTFWFTGEYYATTGTAPWRTRVGSFKLDACGGGGTPPAAPSGLTAAAASSSQISLGWTDNSSNENGFRIERCQNAGCSSFSQIAEVGSNVTAFGDSGLAPSTTYVYRVRAFNAEGTSSYSNAAEATTQAAPPASNSHVGDLDGSGANDGRNWTANVMVSVHDTHHSPVANAMVSGTWSNGATGSAACTTNSSGSCTVSNGGIRKKTGSVSFSVTAVSHAGLTYTPPENHDPDGDSNGTTITVSRP
jgi:hypothetical protein